MRHKLFIYCIYIYWLVYTYIYIFYHPDDCSPYLPKGPSTGTEHCYRPTKLRNTAHTYVVARHLRLCPVSTESNTGSSTTASALNTHRYGFVRNFVCIRTVPVTRCVTFRSQVATGKQAASELRNAQYRAPALRW